MITILEASVNDIQAIQNIASITWPITYGKILSKAQLEYMLELIYSDEALMFQINKKEQLFFLIRDVEETIGFFSIENNYKNEAITKINKLYLLPETQGKGFGKKVIEIIEKLALRNNATKLSLNVNKFNSALSFYQKIGFKIIEEVNIDIGRGYLMEDFVMEKELCN